MGAYILQVNTELDQETGAALDWMCRNDERTKAQEIKWLIKEEAKRRAVVGVDVASGFDGGFRAADHLAVALHGFAVGDGAEADLVPGGNRVERGDGENTRKRIQEMLGADTFRVTNGSQVKFLVP